MVFPQPERWRARGLDDLFAGKMCSVGESETEALLKFTLELERDKNSDSMVQQMHGKQKPDAKGRVFRPVGLFFFYAVQYCIAHSDCGTFVIP